MSDENIWTGPVVDAHHHFWDPIANDHPWLRPGVIIPFRYGDYSAIKRPYLPDDYRKDAAGHAVCETVYVETEWDPNTPLDETRYASGLNARYRLPNAIVGQAWLNRDDAATVIAGQAAFPLVRSIRHKDEILYGGCFFQKFCCLCIREWITRAGLLNEREFSSRGCRGDNHAAASVFAIKASQGGAAQFRLGDILRDFCISQIFLNDHRIRCSSRARWRATGNGHSGWGGDW